MLGLFKQVDRKVASLVWRATHWVAQHLGSTLPPSSKVGVEYAPTRVTTVDGGVDGGALSATTTATATVFPLFPSVVAVGPTVAFLLSLLVGIFFLAGLGLMFRRCHLAHISAQDWLPIHSGGAGRRGQGARGVAKALRRQARLPLLVRLGRQFTRLSFVVATNREVATDLDVALAQLGDARAQAEGERRVTSQRQLALVNAIAARNAVKHELDNLSKELSECAENAAATRLERDGLQQRYSDLQQQVEAARAALAPAQEKIADLSRDLQLSQGRLADAKARILALQAEVAAGKSALASAKADRQSAFESSRLLCEQQQLLINLSKAKITAGAEAGAGYGYDAGLLFGRRDIADLEKRLGEADARAAQAKRDAARSERRLFTAATTWNATTAGLRRQYESGSRDLDVPSQLLDLLPGGEERRVVLERDLAEVEREAAASENQAAAFDSQYRDRVAVWNARLEVIRAELLVGPPAWPAEVFCGTKWAGFTAAEKRRRLRAATPGP